MQPIIQKTADTSLPDFRNLGTILRILLAVNGTAAVVALAAVPRWDLWSIAWFDMVAQVEPVLLMELLVLYAIQPRLARWPRVTGIAIVLGLTLILVLLVDVFGARSDPVSQGRLLRDAVLGLALAAVLLGYFHLRAKALSPAISEARLQALQARIRPHFLFNSMNAVLSLVRSEPRRAEVAIEDMADLFRVLMRDNRDLVPLEDEIELCRQYLALEKLRLGDRLHVEWHLNSMPANALVPPLVLQPLLENAVYHGIEPSSQPGIVTINIFYKSGDVHIIVRNPYRVEGGRHHGGNKMALNNVRERLALHFDAEARLRSQAKSDSYEVHIALPYRPAPDAVRASGPVTVAADGPAVQRRRTRKEHSSRQSLLPRPEVFRG